MKEDYEDMIYWAFGRTNFNYNIKEVMVAWDVRHPNLPPLKFDKERDLVLNMKFLMFQITKYWMESKITYDDRPGLFSMCRGMFRDLFRRKESVV